MEEDLSRRELTVLTVHFLQKENRGGGRSRGDRDLTSLSLFLILASFIPYIFTIPQKSAAQALFASYENRRSKSLLASSRVLGKENYAAWEGIKSRVFNQRGYYFCATYLRIGIESSDLL